MKCSECLNAQTANFSIDGWSSVHNKPILCTVVTTKKGGNFLVDTNDTESDYVSANFYIVEYLKDVVKNSITNCEKDFVCTVRSFVANNAFSVKICTFNFKMIQITI